MLGYHYMKVDREALAKADLNAELSDVEREAQRRFYSAYNLPEHVGTPTHPLALIDLARMPVIPRWVAGLLTSAELRQIEEVKRHGNRTG